MVHSQLGILDIEIGSRVAPAFNRKWLIVPRTVRKHALDRQVSGHLLRTAKIREYRFAMFVR